MKRINYKKITLEELAAITSRKLQEHNIDSILVGGGCVSIYSQNRYESYDLDYVTYAESKKIEKALNELHFYKVGRHFEHKQCQYFIETTRWRPTVLVVGGNLAPLLLALNSHTLLMSPI